MISKRYKTIRTTEINHSIWRSIVVGGEIAGKWWFSAWVLTLLSGVVAFGLTVAKITNIDSSVWIALLVLGVIVAPMVAFHFLRVERDEYKALWDDKHHLIDLLENIEKARAVAVKLQIQGRKFSNQAELDAWIKKVNNWIRNTHEKVYLLHPAEAGNFNTLGLFPPELSFGTQIYNPQHQQTLLNLIRRIHILEEIRNRWTTRF
jgi:hypothetical protein